MADNWELALIAVIEREIAQLEWLINCEQSGEDDVGQTDVRAQVCRIGGLTDLSLEGGLPLSETGIANLRQQNEVVMHLLRGRR